MKVFGLATLVATVALLAGCSKPDDSKIIALERRITILEGQVTQLASRTNAPAPVIMTNTLSAAQIAEVKIWTLNKLEEIKVNEAKKRYELRTNLLDFIEKSAEIVLRAQTH